jgi:ribonuclease HI
MEILAAIQALKDNPDQNFTIYTDSKYLKNGITRWIHKWQKNNWMRTKKKEVKNKELWKDLYELVKDRNIKWEWVEGHSGNIFNDIADELANYNF